MSGDSLGQNKVTNVPRVLTTLCPHLPINGPTVVVIPTSSRVSPLDETVSGENTYSYEPWLLTQEARE